MHPLVSIVTLGCACAAMAGCSTPQADRTLTVAALRAEPAPARAPTDAARARASMAWGDRFTAANLFEQAAVADDTVLNRFNRATGYQRTGRTAEAAALYRDLVRDGEYTNVKLDPRYDGAKGGVTGVNVADESARRLGMIQGPAALSSAAAGPVSADQAGVNASAVEGTSRISDEEALARDTAAHP